MNDSEANNRAWTAYKDRYDMHHIEISEDDKAAFERTLSFQLQLLQVWCDNFKIEGRKIFNKGAKEINDFLKDIK